MIILKKYFLSLISAMLILEGKVALYKRGYHVLLRRLRRMTKEMKLMKRENVRLNNLVQMHEDLAFLF